MESRKHVQNTEVGKEDGQYSVDAIAYNLATGIFFIPLALFVMVIAQWSATEWSDTLTQIYLYIFLVMLIFALWFPFSPMVKRKVTFHSDKVMIGKRVIEVKKIKRMVIEKNGTILALKVDKINEPVKVKLENKFHSGMKSFLIEWCTQAKIPLAEKEQK